MIVDFPDVNVWVALSTGDHEGHRAAKRYFERDAADRLGFSWATGMGLVRVTSHRHTFGGDPLSPSDAWRNLERWLRHPDVVLLADPIGLQERLAEWVAEGLATPRAWTDLYLAAFAACHEARFVTFDRAFRRFPGLNVLRLEA